MKEKEKKISKQQKEVFLWPIALGIIQLGFLLYCFYKGKGSLYFRAAIPMYFIIVLFYLFACYLRANQWIVFWMSILLTIGLLTQILLIGHISMENNAKKSIVYEIHKISAKEEVIQLYKGQSPLSDLISVEDAKSLDESFGIDFTEIKSAADLSVSQAKKACNKIEKSKLFPEYKKILKRRTHIREANKADDIRNTMMIGFGMSIIIAMFLLFVYGHYYDFFIYVWSVLDIIIMVVLIIWGRGGGANITVLGIQPFEIVKFCYLFVLAAIFCKPERREYKIAKMDRFCYARIFMIVNIAFFMIISELGTMLILTCTSLCFLFIFCDERKFMWKIFGLFALIALVGSGICLLQYRFDLGAMKSILYDFYQISESEEEKQISEKITKDEVEPVLTYITANYNLNFKVVSKAKDLPDEKSIKAFNYAKSNIVVIDKKGNKQNVILDELKSRANYLGPLSNLCRKVYTRFFYAMNPNLDAYGDGYQYLQMRKGTAVAGWFGASVARYKFYISEEETDVVYTKIVQMMGVSMGILLLLCYIGFLYNGYNASFCTEDIYYKGLAMGISILLAFQGLLHIACNVGLFALSGVPLLFISKGGSNQAVSFGMTMILLIISTKGMKRAIGDEEEFEEEKGFAKIKKTIGRFW